MKNTIPLASKHYNHGALKTTKDTIRISLNMEWEAWKNIKLAAESEGLYVGALIRKLIEKYLEE